MRNAFACLLAAALLAAIPSVALAQSAGDDQYVDPLNGLTGGGSGGGANESAGGSVETGEAGVAGSAEADVNGLPGELARTGVELPLVAGAGVLLLAGGIGLRRLSGERR